MCCEIVGCERGCGYEYGCVSVDVRGCGEGVEQSIETKKRS